MCTYIHTYIYTHTVLDDRDSEAKRDFKMLQKELSSDDKPVKKAAQHEENKENAITKELHVLESKQRKEQARETKIAKKEKKEREDRDAMAEQYCEYLCVWRVDVVCIYIL